MWFYAGEVITVLTFVECVHDRLQSIPKQHLFHMGNVYGEIRNNRFYVPENGIFYKTFDNSFQKRK